jgi:hypothetical protein
MFKLKFGLLVISAMSLSSCSINGSSGNEVEQITSKSKICELIIEKFNITIVSLSDIDKVRAWNLILDNPSCFVSGSVDIAIKELEILQNNKS